MTGGTRLSRANRTFSNPPWHYHHSDSVLQGRIRVYAENAQDYYSTDPSLPLCAARQVHSGPEHVRVVRFVSYENWRDTLDLYRLIINSEPDITKPDFYLYTMCQYPTYDVQFALKRLPKSVSVATSERTTLQFRVSDIGQLVPLLPNMCTQTGDVNRWQTTDLDGNPVVLHVCDNSHDNSSILQDSFSPDNSFASSTNSQDHNSSLNIASLGARGPKTKKVDLNQGFYI